MRDGVLARVKPNILRPYLMKREDYASVGIEKIVGLSSSKRNVMETNLWDS